MPIYGEYIVSTINQGRPARRAGQIAGAAVLAAVSGWLALDYLADAPLPGVADAVAVPVQVTHPAPALLNVAAGASTTTLQSNPPASRAARPRAKRPAVDSVIGEAPLSGSDQGAPATTDLAWQTPGLEASSSTLLPPPVAMLAAVCALQKKLADTTQTH